MRREFTGEALPWLEAQPTAATCAASIRTAQHLSSAIFAYGSSTGLVSMLAAASREWKGANTGRRAARSERRHELTLLVRRAVGRTSSPAFSARERRSARGVTTLAVGARR